MRFSASDLSSWLNGELLVPDPIPGSGAEFDGVSIDSRTIEPGNLFVPVVAERDGHDFIPAALAAGATGYLTSQSSPSLPTDPLPVSERQPGPVAIRVADTSAALTAIGRLARSRLSGPVIAITGSVGKTSTKDLTLAACCRSKVAHGSERSFNNELGVPLTLANAPDGTEVAVIEMGARGAGHIADLCRVAQPTIGVVTSVALAHSEMFGTIEAVAAAKGEMVEPLPPSGVAVLNADDPWVSKMAGRTEASVLSFGMDRGDVRASGVTLDPVLRPSFTLVTPSGRFDVQLEARGTQMALAAAGAVAAAIAAGVDDADAVAGVATAALSPWRMEVGQAPSGLVVINDAYNANPTSMRAALDALGSIPATDRIAVLGTMAELGPEGLAEHRAIAALAAEAGIQLVAVAAPDYGPAARHIDNRSDAVAALTELTKLSAGTAVLVKGSRVAGLEAVASELLAVE